MNFGEILTKNEIDYTNHLRSSSISYYFEIGHLTRASFPISALPFPILGKKPFISSILLCAFAILFAHSVIPHHHDDENYAHHSGSHHSDENDHDDIDRNFLGQAFSHFQHEHGGTVIYETASSELQCQKINFDKNAFTLVHNIVRVLLKPPLKHHPPKSIYFTSSLYSVATLLRGPPVTEA